MKNYILFLLLVFNVSCSSHESANLRVIKLEGTPYNRGLKHGQILKEEIGIIIDRWKTKTEAWTGFDFEDTKRAFLSKNKYKDAILSWNPDLLNEVEGIAKGSGIDFETIFLFQMGEELHSQSGITNLSRCTSIGVSKSDKNPCLVAQNMDPPYFLHGFPTLLHIKHNDSDLESYIFTSPGLIALNGMNNRAIGIVANGLPNLYANFEGMPVAFVIRTVLAKSTLGFFAHPLEKVHLSIGTS